MTRSISQQLTEKKQKGNKQFALLIDPDAIENDAQLENTCQLAKVAKVDYILVGGSLITNGYLDRCITLIKQCCSIPVLLFPGDIMQVNHKADGILLLSLISGRNPELLIGKHVVAAPMLKQSGLEVIASGYMLIDGGRTTSVSYMSNTTPIPNDKADIAACTAMAGEMMGLHIIYMDAGSGAESQIPGAMISKVHENVDIPIFVGGGIRTAQQALDAAKAGADVVVVGNAVEKDPTLMQQMAELVHSC